MSVTQEKKQRISKCTDKTPYKSKFKEGYITPANYIVEVIFEKRHNHFNKGKPPENFWNNPNYNGLYKKELFGINRLLKTFSHDSIIKALTSDECRYIMKVSYGKNWSDEKFESENQKLINQIKIIEKNKKTTEVVKSVQEIKEVAKPFSTKKTNIFKDL